MTLHRRSLVRSWEDAVQHPRATGELLLGHAVAFCVRPGPWLGTSLMLTGTHLGLLGGDRDGLGWANRLTLVRANLPALVRTTPGWMAAAPLASDWLDGQLARRTEETAFGAYADALADVSFWTWFAMRHEADRRLRLVGVTLWAGPAAIISLMFFVQARSVDYPRLVAMRNLSVLAQVLITVRVVAAARRHHRRMRRPPSAGE